MAITVQNSKSMPAKPLHTFIYGPLRTSKTTSAATWPSPVFLSAGNEGGDTSLRFQSVDVIVIKNVQDMKDAIAYIDMHGKTKHGWKTIVVDSLTYYSDLFIQQASNNGEKPLQQRDWGLLDLHLQKWLLPKVMSMPYHAVWIANEDEVKDTNGSVTSYSPSLYGKTKVKFPGSTDLIVRTTIRTSRNQQGQLQSEYLFKTISTDGSPIGGRFGPAFAEGIIPAHFQAIAQRIGPWIGEEVKK